MSTFRENKTKNKQKLTYREEDKKRQVEAEIREGRGYGLHIPKKKKKILLFFLSEWRRVLLYIHTDI